MSKTQRPYQRKYQRKRPVQEAVYAKPGPTYSRAPAHRAYVEKEVIRPVTSGRPIKVVGYGAYHKKKRQDDRSIGHKIGSTIGGFLGHGIQQLIKNVTGFGDYNVQGNTLLMGGMTPPQIINSYDHGGIILRHREYIKDITSNIGFTSQAFDINPGLIATFPWLAQVAQNFEEYEMRGLIFEFKSTSSDAVLSTSTSSSLGSVMMATQYDTLQPNFPNKVSLLNHEFANSAKPSECFYHPVECKRSRTPVSQLFVRSGPVPTAGDERLYDLGRFQIATEGQQAIGGNIGELWATYEILLSKPIKPVSVPVGAVLSDHFQLSGWSSAAPLGTSSVRTSTSSLLSGVAVGGATLLFPTTGPFIGNFLVTIMWSGQTGATITYPTVTGYGNSTILSNMFIGNSSSTLTSPLAGTPSAVRCQLTFILSLSGEGRGGFILGTAGSLPTGTNQPCDMIITQIDTDLVNLMKQHNIQQSNHQIENPNESHIYELDDEEDDDRIELRRSDFAILPDAIKLKRSDYAKLMGK